MGQLTTEKIEGLFRDLRRELNCYDSNFRIVLSMLDNKFINSLESVVRICQERRQKDPS